MSTVRMAETRGADHLRAVGWIHLAQGVIYAGLLAWFLAWLLPDLVTGRSPLLFTVLLIIGFVAAILGFLAGASVWCGLGLLRHDARARVGAIALSLLQLAYVPVGTIAGAYALWVLMSEERTRALRERAG